MPETTTTVPETTTTVGQSSGDSGSRPGDGGASVSGPEVMSAAAAPTMETLPVTGLPTTDAASLGAALLAVGFLLLAATHRRAPAEHS